MTTINDYTCEYFALCTNPAEFVVGNPVLGWVPCCTRCADRVDVPADERRECVFTEDDEDDSPENRDEDDAWIDEHKLERA